MIAIPTVIARIKRLLDLDADPIAIAAHLSEDPELERLVTACSASLRASTGRLPKKLPPAVAQLVQPGSDLTN